VPKWKSRRELKRLVASLESELRETNHYIDVLCDELQVSQDAATSTKRKLEELQLALSEQKTVYRNQFELLRELATAAKIETCGLRLQMSRLKGGLND
jgi:septal ring factor EnvC (AmiA/AmiB activator)